MSKTTSKGKGKGKGKSAECAKHYLLNCSECAPTTSKGKGKSDGQDDALLTRTVALDVSAPDGSTVRVPLTHYVVSKGRAEGRVRAGLASPGTRPTDAERACAAGVRVADGGLDPRTFVVHVDGASAVIETEARTGKRGGYRAGAAEVRVGKGKSAEFFRVDVSARIVRGAWSLRATVRPGRLTATVSGSAATAPVLDLAALGSAVE